MADQKPSNFKPARDVELNELAEISPSDVERAKITWRKDANPQYRDLLDAELEIEEEE